MQRAIDTSNRIFSTSFENILQTEIPVPLTKNMDGAKMEMHIVLYDMVAKRNTVYVSVFCDVIIIVIFIYRETCD